MSARSWATSPAPPPATAPVSRLLVRPLRGPTMRMPRDRSRRKTHRMDAAAWPPTPRETAQPAPSSSPEEDAAPAEVLDRLPPLPTEGTWPSWQIPMTSLPAPSQHHRCRLKQNPQVHPQAPTVDVFNIQVYPSLERRIPSRRDLPKSRHPRQHIQTWQVFNRIGGKVVQRMRPRPDQAHLAFQHIP